MIVTGMINVERESGARRLEEGKEIGKKRRELAIVRSCSLALTHARTHAHSFAHSLRVAGARESGHIYINILTRDDCTRSGVTRPAAERPIIL